MIVTKTPLRVSFFGGGSDVEAFYSQHGGAVLSTTIDKYIHLSVQQVARPHYKVMYSEVEQVDDISHIKHDRVKMALTHFGIESGIEIASFADIPTKGTGLGSSSAFTAGLIQALATYTGQQLSRYDVAELACDIEINDCGENIGKQDQYASTFGGFNFITFAKEGVEVAPVNISTYTLESFSDNLLCFYTGQTRSASNILTDQVEKLKRKDSDITFFTKELVDMAHTAKAELRSGRLHNVGALLDDGWRIKKKLSSGISNPLIDQMYEDALKAGALGGKLLGAGGGGYLLLYVPSHNQVRVLEKLKHYQNFVFNFTDKGSTVVYSDHVY
jgi:D-glycero-alpha-D-manno-heptose-7-phosphate kinase